jgi:hypothetical protein
MVKNPLCTWSLIRGKIKSPVISGAFFAVGLGKLLFSEFLKDGFSVTLMVR